mmetsp:Transcript_61082/g.119799  ORF Transcript_61082/g.119799 Transcript_61082/m.119799 type:complete len:484 (-) Transcript_61082:64-1515(-)
MPGYLVGCNSTVEQHGQEEVFIVAVCMAICPSSMPSFPLYLRKGGLQGGALPCRWLVAVSWGEWWPPPPARASLGQVVEVERKVHLQLLPGLVCVLNERVEVHHGGSLNLPRHHEHGLPVFHQRHRVHAVNVHPVFGQHRGHLRHDPRLVHALHLERPGPDSVLLHGVVPLQQNLRRREPVLGTDVCEGHREQRRNVSVWVREGFVERLLLAGVHRHHHHRHELPPHLHHLRLRHVALGAGDDGVAQGAQEPHSVGSRRHHNHVVQARVQRLRLVKQRRSLVAQLVQGFLRAQWRVVAAPHRAQNARPQQRSACHHGDAQVHGAEGEVEQGRRHPHLPKRHHVFLVVVGVLGEAVRHASAPHHLFEAVEHGEVQKRVVHTLVDEHLPEHGSHALEIGHLLANWLGRKAGGIRKQASKERHVEKVLYASKVETTEHGERRVSPPVNILELLVLELELHQEVGSRGLYRTECDAERHRVAFAYSK